MQAECINKQNKKKDKQKLLITDDEQELDGLVNEDDENGVVSARPRRMSEVNAATKIVPIPPASAFFVFSQTSRFYILLYLLII